MARPRKPVDEALAKGRDVLFDIDWQGTQQIAQVMMEDLVRIFILPPSSDELQNRLINRAQDSSTVVAKRMAEASNEISHWAEYDYVIVNDELEDSHAQVTAILTAERLRRRRRIGLTEFVRGLTKGLDKSELAKSLRQSRKIIHRKLLGPQFRIDAQFSEDGFRRFKRPAQA